MHSRLTRLPLQAAAVLAITTLAFGVHAQGTTTPAKGAAAATPAESATSVFKRIDANQDGKVSRDEAARLPAIAEKFDQLDKDKDGMLSPEEFSAGLEMPKQ